MRARAPSTASRVECTGRTGRTCVVLLTSACQHGWDASRSRTGDAVHTARLPHGASVDGKKLAHTWEIFVHVPPR